MKDFIKQKRELLQTLVESHLALHTEVQAVVATGSIVTGLARPDSDIDAIIFYDPYDPFIIPAEFKWEVGTDNFYSIFDPNLEGKQIGHFDFKRLDLAQWEHDSFVWPESMCAMLENGWIAYDRSGRVTKLIKERTYYSEAIRLNKLDDAILNIEQNLDEEKVRKRWDSLPPIVAHNRLQSAYDYLIQALFAYNNQWRPWQNREMSVLISLPWLPEKFEERAFGALTVQSADKSGYVHRWELLCGLFQDVQDRLITDGVYGNDILGEAFVRIHDEPGRAWNMDEWNIEHTQRFKK